MISGHSAQHVDRYSIGYLDNPCQGSAEWSQGGVDLWPDIAMKLAHYFKISSVHIENRKLNNLLLSRPCTDDDKMHISHLFFYQL